MDIRQNTPSRPILDTSSGNYVEALSPWTPPLLRWAGSKRKLLPILLANVPANFGRYVEPFVGSACLFFAIRPQAAVLGDINQELLETYTAIKNHPRLVYRKAVSWKTDKRTYYRVRKWLPDSLNTIDRAARFVYLNRYCFNGVYRINRSGQFNVPRGVRTGKLPDETKFYRSSIALRAVEFRPGDFTNCLSDVRKGDFVYLDPPYASSGRSRFGEYSYESFADVDVPRLLKALRRIDRLGAIFLLSYSDTPLLTDHIRHWHCARISVRRHVAGFANNRPMVSEVLISNQPVVECSNG